MSQKPTVGRTVHFLATSGDVGPYAAIVTAVNPDDTVELVTFGRNSVYFNHAVPFSEEPAAGCWSWPPRAPAAPHPGLPTSGPPAWCNVCPHPVGLHNPDGSCGCGSDCAAQPLAEVNK